MKPLKFNKATIIWKQKDGVFNEIFYPTQSLVLGAPNLFSGMGTRWPVKLHTFKVPVIPFRLQPVLSFDTLYPYLPEVGRSSKTIFSGNHTTLPQPNLCPERCGPSRTGPGIPKGHVVNLVITRIRSMRALNLGILGRVS